MSGYRTALERLREHMGAGDWRAALRMAAKWPELGAERDAIRTAWDALVHPEFYRELGKDPEALVAEGRAALARRYGSAQR